MNIKKIRKKIKKWIIKSAERPLLDTLSIELKDCDSVLDVGCGINSPLGKIKEKKYLEGIDALPKSKALKIYDKYTKGNITDLTKYYNSKSFDGIVVLDVIEHLKKNDGIKLLKDLNKIARKKIIVLTPSGFMEQGPVGGNKFMIHLSGWEAKEFRKLNFRTYGMHGIKWLRGDEASIRFKPWYLWLYISHLSQNIAKYFPKIAFHIIAIKKIETNK